MQLQIVPHPDIEAWSLLLDQPGQHTTDYLVLIEAGTLTECLTFGREFIAKNGHVVSDMVQEDCRGNITQKHC